jgi:hypothetical protein
VPKGAASPLARQRLFHRYSGSCLSSVPRNPPVPDRKALLKSCPFGSGDYHAAP